MKTYSTEQERFWAGSFGTEYIARNTGPDLLAANLALFAEILKPLARIGSVLEFGANVGMNLRALSLLLLRARLEAVEINDAAVTELRAWGGAAEIHHGAILDFEPIKPVDMVFTKGVLIHMPPEQLPAIYDKLHAATGRYLCVAEYFSRTPGEVEYRGYRAKLFKRDFSGEILDRHPGLILHSSGFASSRSPNFPQDDLTWHLLEKRS